MRRFFLTMMLLAALVAASPMKADVPLPFPPLPGDPFPPHPDIPLPTDPVGPSLPR